MLTSETYRVLWSGHALSLAGFEWRLIEVGEAKTIGSRIKSI